MKQLSYHLLLTILLVFSFNLSGWGQKHCDLALRVVSPAQATDIPFGDTLGMYISVKNLGPDAIDSSNAFYLVMDSIPWPTYFTDLSIPVGDSEIFRPYFMVNGQEDTDLHYVMCSYLQTADSGVFVDNNPENDTACMDVTLKTKNSTGLSNGYYGKLSVQLYPNPANSRLCLQINTGEASSLSVSIQNIVGITLIKKEKKVHQGNNVFSFDVSYITPGIYFVKIENSEAKFWVKKLVIN